MHVYFTQNQVMMKILIFVELILGLSLLACSLTPQMPAANNAVKVFSTEKTLPSPIPISFTPEQTETLNPTTCTASAADALHLRDAPTYEGEVIAWLFNGEILTISSNPPIGTWVKATRADGMVGFINSNFCEVTQ